MISANDVRSQSFKKGLFGYKTADVDYLMTLYSVSYREYKDMVKRILEVEAPLYEEDLIRRTLRYFDREKYTSVVDEKYNNAMRRHNEYGIVKRNGFLYLKDKKIEFRSEGDYHRELSHIAPEELAVGMLRIVMDAKAVSKEGLYKIIGELCGIKRLTAENTRYLDSVLEKSKNHLVVGNDGFITVKQDSK